MKQVIFLAAIVLGLNVWATTSMAAENCTEQLVKHCTSCHYNTRICNKIGKKNERAWKSTVKRMLRYGLKLDSGVEENIVSCLAEIKDKSDPFCQEP